MCTESVIGGVGGAVFALFVAILAFFGALVIVGFLIRISVGKK